jgi:hypothetical protein
MMRTGLAALCFCVLAVVAQAGDGENLVVAPYPATVPWKKITDHHEPRMTMYEWIPADQSEDNIGDILTEQDFPGLANTDPSLFVHNMLARMGGACKDVRINGPKAGTQNGYPVAYAQVYCAGQRDAHKDIDIFIKAIAGKNALYVAQREFRRPEQPGAMAGVAAFNKDQLGAMTARLKAQSEADRFLVDQVQLCPLASGDGACPAALTATPAADTAPAAAPASPAEDSLPPFVNGKSTVDDVRAKFGRPTQETHLMGPDGPYAYVYSLQDGNVLLSFLFSKDGVLIRARGYKHGP